MTQSDTEVRYDVLAWSPAEFNAVRRELAKQGAPFRIVGRELVVDKQFEPLVDRVTETFVSQGDNASERSDVSTKRRNYLGGMALALGIVALAVAVYSFVVLKADLDDANARLDRQVSQIGDVEYELGFRLDDVESLADDIDFRLSDAEGRIDDACSILRPRC